MRSVTVHEAKTHVSRLIDAAHAGETILLAKSGRPWARRQPGVLRGRLQLPPPEVLMAPLPEEELQAIEASSLP